MIDAWLFQGFNTSKLTVLASLQTIAKGLYDISSYKNMVLRYRYTTAFNQILVSFYLLQKKPIPQQLLVNRNGTFSVIKGWWSSQKDRYFILSNSTWNPISTTRTDQNVPNHILSRLNPELHMTSRSVLVQDVQQAKQTFFRPAWRQLILI